MISKTFYTVELKFFEPILGSQASKDVATQFIAAKNGFDLPEDELDSLPEALDKGTTVFHRDPAGLPCLYDYHVKGFLKEAGRVMNKRIKVNGKPVLNLRAKVANDVFVSPRQISIVFQGDINHLERPLRAETAMGPRVALARSEQIEGASITFGLEVLDGEIIEEVLRDLLEYGFNQGIGQWRSGGFGRFTYTLTKEQ